MYPTFGSRLYVFIRKRLIPLAGIEKYLPKKGTILDIGCGYGLASIYLALKSPARKVIGLELSKKRVQIARKAAKGIKNLEFRQQDFIKTKKLGKCSAILMIDLLHHIPYPTQKRLLQECYKKLNKKGILLIKDIATKPRHKYLWNYLHDKIMTKNQKLYFQHPKNLKNLLEHMGFRVKIKPMKSRLYPHIIYVCEKI